MCREDAGTAGATPATVSVGVQLLECELTQQFDSGRQKLEFGRAPLSCRQGAHGVGSRGGGDLSELSYPFVHELR